MPLNTLLCVFFKRGLLMILASVLLRGLSYDSLLASETLLCVSYMKDFLCILPLIGLFCLTLERTSFCPYRLFCLILKRGLLNASHHEDSIPHNAWRFFDCSLCFKLVLLLTWIELRISIQKEISFQPWVGMVDQRIFFSPIPNVSTWLAPQVLFS